MATTSNNFLTISFREIPSASDSKEGKMRCLKTGEATSWICFGVTYSSPLSQASAFAQRIKAIVARGETPWAIHFASSGSYFSGVRGGGDQRDDIVFQIFGNEYVGNSSAGLQHFFFSGYRMAGQEGWFACLFSSSSTIKSSS